MKKYETDSAVFYGASPSANFLKGLPVEPTDPYITDGVKTIAVRGSNASAQILICAKTDLSYTVKIGSVKDERNGAFGEKVTPFAVRYITVDRNWHGNGAPLGDYPDLLLPMDVAERYGENTVKSGATGAVWLDVAVGRKCKPGVYKGFIEVATNGEKAEVDFAVEVLSAEIGDDVTVKTVFTTNARHMEHNEGERTQKMFDAYRKMLWEHRLCQTGLLVNEQSDSDCAGYCAAAYAFIRSGGSTVNIPTGDVKKEDGQYYFDRQVVYNHLKALAEYSLKTGIDLVSRAVFYDWRIDEPFGCNYPEYKVARSVHVFTDVLKKVAAECEKNAKFDTKLGKRVIASVLSVPHIITDYADRNFYPLKPKTDESGNPYEYDLKQVALCPKFDGYDTEELRERYKEQKEKWWYGCNAPGSPYPSYHIDGGAWSGRIVGWLMARFGIVGNLYWVTNISTEINTTGKPLFLDDPYGTAHRGFGANGDGVILYPGKNYGVFGPLACVRLKQIRAGNEDYELIKALKEGYAAKGKDLGGTFDRITAPLCSGTRIDWKSAHFDRAAETLYRLADAFCSPAGLTVETKESDGFVKFTVTAEHGTQIFADGEKLLPDENFEYGISLPISGERYVEIKAILNGVEKSVKLYAGERLYVTLHEELYGQNAVSGDISELTINRDEIRRQITAELNAGNPTVKIKLKKPVTERTQRLAVELRSYGESEVEIVIENSSKNFKLVHGWNRAECELENCRADEIELKLKNLTKLGIGAILTLG